jgi:hypothetical protein
MAPVAGILGALALAVVFVALRDRWQRWWFELEDPRPLARFRIVFCLLLLGDVAVLHPWFDFLFEPEGLFTADEAREIWGARGDGLFDALVGFVSGRFSILYYWDGPRAFAAALGSFVVSATLFMVGFRTRITGVLTLLLLDSILMRNRVFWEGTEAVFRVWLVYLVCSRCGETLSVDAWLRRRRAESAAPSLVPAWPRRLMMVQLCILMITTGLLKHEGPWVDGDAVYYALTYEHYARFRLERIFAFVGPVPLAVLTVVARSVEVFFPFVLVGIVGRWARTRFAPLQGRRRIVVHAALLVALVAATLVVLATGKPRLLPVESTPVSAVALVVVCVGVYVVWTREGAAPLRGLFDRRLWLAAAALLFCGMWLLMNIGFFHPAMLATLLPFLGVETGPTRQLAYSPRTRAVLGVVLALHLVIVAVTVMPVRSGADVVTRPWVWATRTEQGWGMWAVVTRENEFLKSVAVDDHGRATDLRTDLYAEELRPPSPWSYDRRWKIAERIVRAPAKSHYPDAYARWLCREHVDAARVELWTVTVPIPTLAENRELGGYDADAILRTRATERLLLDHTCR